MSQIFFSYKNSYSVTNVNLQTMTETRTKRQNIKSEHVPLSEKIKLYQKYLEKDRVTRKKYKLKNFNRTASGRESFSDSVSTLFDKLSGFWTRDHTEIQAKYGNICLCYFTLHKWLFVVNFIIGLMVFVFLLMPNLVLRKYNLYINSFDNVDQEKCFLTANGQQLPYVQSDSSLIENIGAVVKGNLWLTNTPFFQGFYRSDIPFHFKTSNYRAFKKFGPGRIWSFLRFLE